MWLVAAGWWEVGAQAQRKAGSGNPIIRRSLSGNRFLYKPFSQVSLFGAESLFGRVSLFGTFGHSLWGCILIWSSPFFDYEVVSLSLKIGCCLVTFALCTVGPRYVAGGSHLVMFLSLKPCRCLVTFRSVSCLCTFLSFEPDRHMGA